MSDLAAPPGPRPPEADRPAGGEGGGPGSARGRRAVPRRRCHGGRAASRLRARRACARACPRRRRGPGFGPCPACAWPSAPTSSTASRRSRPTSPDPARCGSSARCWRARGRASWASRSPPSSRTRRTAPRTGPTRWAIDYEPLAAIASIDDALDADLPPLHGDTNVIFREEHHHGDVDRAFAEAAVVVERTFRNPRYSAGADGEPRRARAARGRRPAGAGRGPRSPTSCRSRSSCCSDSRAGSACRCPDIGGGFGQKAHVFPEEIAVAWAALRLGAPVKWVEDRRENLLSSSHAREQRVRARVAADAEGRVLAIDAEVYCDVGAYGIYPWGQVLESLGTPMILPGPYELHHYRYVTHSLATNKAPQGAYRGVGLPVAAFVRERMMDLVAAELGLDRAEVRRVNFVPPRGLPLRHRDRPALRQRRLPARRSTPRWRRIGYADFQAERQRAAREGRRLGLGIASYVEWTGTNSATYRGRGMSNVRGYDAGRVAVNDDGTVSVWTSCPAIGQGVGTTFAQIVAEHLGVPFAMVRTELVDTAQFSAGQRELRQPQRDQRRRRADRGVGPGARAHPRHRRRRARGRPRPTSSSTPRGAWACAARRPRRSRWPRSSRRPSPGTSTSASPTTPRRPPTPTRPTRAWSRSTPRPAPWRSSATSWPRTAGRRSTRSWSRARCTAPRRRASAATLYEAMRFGADGQAVTGSFMDYLGADRVRAARIACSHLETPAPTCAAGSRAWARADARRRRGRWPTPSRTRSGVEINELPIDPELVLRAVSGAERVALRCAACGVDGRALRRSARPPRGAKPRERRRRRRVVGRERRPAPAAPRARPREQRRRRRMGPGDSGAPPNRDAARGRANGGDEGGWVRAVAALRPNRDAACEAARTAATKGVGRRGCSTLGVIVTPKVEHP